MKGLCGLALGLLLGLATLLPAEPPLTPPPLPRGERGSKSGTPLPQGERGSKSGTPLPQGERGRGEGQGRTLTADEQKEVFRLNAKMDRHLSAGQFEDAVQAAKRVVDYRSARQGASHWEVIDARINLEQCQGWASVPVKDRAEVVGGLSTTREALLLQRRLRYREAEAKWREGLAIWQKVLGEKHPHSGMGYNRLAGCLESQGKYTEALPLYQNALSLRRKVLGERHPLTATCYNNVALCLQRQGRLTEALPLYRKALAVRQQTLGKQHPFVAQSYNNLAACLNNQGQYAEALPLFRKALNLRLKLLGEQHSDTAQSYNNVASCLNRQGQYAEALSLLHRALLIRRQVRGEQHPDTAASYNNLAYCLNKQGKHAEAVALARHALDLFQTVLGERHPLTAHSCNNLADCLNDQGSFEEALPLYRKALAIRIKVLGERHPATATSYDSLALCLRRQGKHTEALPLYRKVLDIRQQVLGEQHPDTAKSYNNVAFCLFEQGQYTAALPLFQRALAVNRKALGEQHPNTAGSYNNLALCLYRQGRYADAARSWRKALLGAEWGRLQANATGFDRSLYKVDVLSPHSALAACLVRLGRPVEAWQHAEADLARGLLEDLLPSAENSAAAARRDRLRQLDQALLPLLSLEKADAEQVRRRDALVKERNALLAELADLSTRIHGERVLSLPRIRKQLPADAALVFWLDVYEHLGCVVRRQGPPVWVRLPGSGKDNTWSKDDSFLSGSAFALLADNRSDTSARQRLLAQLYRQRLAPLEPHLKGVRQLLVVPNGAMSIVPVESLTNRYTISYVSSASVFARWAEQHRPLQATSLLVLADPVFKRGETAPAVEPAHGLLVLSLTPGSLAGRVGLRPGDVLLEYNGAKLSMPADLAPSKGVERVPVKLWRDGKTLAGRIPAGNLGVIVDKRPLSEALAAWRKQEKELLTLGRGDWQPLPGTRLEARSLAALVPGSTVLLGSDASQQKLTELAAVDKLKDFRLLHLATHGQANPAQPRLTALILAQDKIDNAATAARAVLAGKQPVVGWLTVGTILKDWRLDADLVVLSACQTGLGAYGDKEGMLGFTQGLLSKGARSVVLSRWKVDDAATALLMTRFYENLLGKRKGVKPLGRAAALAEAKAWLRTLSRAEATKRLAVLVDGLPRGERGSIKAALPTRQPDAPKGEGRPFAAPYYWAAFILIGDPD